MRSALLWVILWMTVYKQRCICTSMDAFYPTPIPLNEWHPDEWRGRELAGTLHETINTAAPPSVAAVPAHYWEDALRHSVYLTLVRDKIDQLIAQDVLSYNHKPNKDVDDHNLWDKIKSAPFDRIEIDEPPNIGDVTVMSKGQLLEDKGGYRFTEDDRSEEKCNDEQCTERVKALWSVKRVRQRDDETSPGRYHYELTFSVITQTPKRQRKPHENPARTFTVREMAPETIVDQPQEHRTTETIPVQNIRPQRALWLHKNIVPQSQQARHYQHRGTERLFASLFMDSDYEVHRRYPHTPPPQHTQYSKIGYVGAPSDNHQYKKLRPYPYKSHSLTKYQRPPMTLPMLHSHPQHHYLDIDAIGVVSSPYIPQPPDTRYNVKPPKATRPVLPTAVNLPPLQKDNNTLLPTGNPTIKKLNTTNHPIKSNDNIPIYNKPKPTQMKISYFTDSVRPPVYNAPPGIFVTMDKKPFKPMPPLKYYSPTKSIKLPKPNDFRPSPQVLDIQFSEPDPLFDGAFRPMKINYTSSSTTEETNVADSSEKEEQIVSSTDVIDQDKGLKKQTRKKSQRITTTTSTEPTSTTESEESDYNMLWGNLLGAFTKTIPMEAQQEKAKTTESTIATITTPMSSTTTEIPTTSEDYDEEKFTTTTTVASTTQKRTRPPPKFKNKIRKLKRVSTTKTPEKVKRPEEDLTPQASSAATSGSRPTTRRTPAPTSTTTQIPITLSTRTTTLPTTTERRFSFTTETQPITEHKPSKDKNRYRQSTLMQKGTSVNHDKWTTHYFDKFSSKTIIPPTGQYPPRRTDSKFQGYAKHSTQSYDYDSEGDDYEDYDLTTTPKIHTIKSTTEKDIIETIENKRFIEESESSHETLDEQSNNEGTSQHKQFHNISKDKETIEEESKEVLNYPKSTTAFSSKTNEIIDNDEASTTELNVAELSDFTPKNKTKCKRKLPKSTTPVPTTKDVEQVTPSVAITTEHTVTPSIFDELFGGFTFGLSDKNSSILSYDDDAVMDDDLDLDESENRFYVVNDDALYTDEDVDNDVKDSNSQRDTRDINVGKESRESDSEPNNYNKPSEREPYSIFELIAME